MRIRHIKFQSYSKFYYLVIGLLSSSCGLINKTNNTADCTYFISTPDITKKDSDLLSIEDYVSLLPVQESIAPWFEKHVYGAREKYRENFGKNSDFLYIGGDGSRGLITFVLDRDQKLLYVTDINWESGREKLKHNYLLYRVPNGWVQSDRVLTPTQLKKPESFTEITCWEGVGG
jgi:hypothetical protein